jgi:hypothetical protein
VKPWKNFGKALECYRRSRAHRRATGGGVMATLAVVPSPAVTAAPLYVIEDQLAALIETAELVSPEPEQEFRAEFHGDGVGSGDSQDERTPAEDPGGSGLRF